MNYEFEGCDNKKCPDKKRDGKFVNVTNYYVVPYSMKDAPNLGAKIPCPRCKKGKITRILSVPEVFVRGSAQRPDLINGQNYMARVGGQDQMITFVDHPHTDPRFGAALAKQAQDAGIAQIKNVSGMRYSEKHKQMVVDVASNMPDPYGALKKNSADYNKYMENKTERVDVKQPIKIRKSEPRSGPISKAEKAKYRIPLRK